MRTFSISEYVSNWHRVDAFSEHCVFGTILYYQEQLLLLDEGFKGDNFRGNARLVIEAPEAQIALEKELPLIGGGPSNFWEAAIVYVDQRKIEDGYHVVVPKKIFFWSSEKEKLSHLIFDSLDEKLIPKCTSPSVEQLDSADPFSEAADFYRKYWSNRM